MQSNKIITKTFALLSLLLATSYALAQSSKERHRPMRIPQEALAACSQLQQGDSCSFTGRHNDTITGTCVTPPPELNLQGLACKPDHPMGRPDGQVPEAPPQDANSKSDDRE